MRPRVVGIGDGVDIEKHRARNMRAEIIVRWQWQHAGHLVGRVDDFDFWVIETGGEPVGGDQRVVGGCHCAKSLLSFRDAPLATSRKRTSFKTRFRVRACARPGMTKGTLTLRL